MLQGSTQWSSLNYTKDEPMGIGFTEGLIIAAIALFFFGGKKIPQLGRTLGASIKGFKEGMHEETEEEKLAKAKAKAQILLLEEEKKKNS